VVPPAHLQIRIQSQLIAADMERIRADIRGYHMLEGDDDGDSSMPPIASVLNPPVIRPDRFLSAEVGAVSAFIRPESRN
jgi:hypothetical protein